MGSNAKKPLPSEVSVRCFLFKAKDLGFAAITSNVDLQTSNSKCCFDQFFLDCEEEDHAVKCSEIEGRGVR